MSCTNGLRHEVIKRGDRRLVDIISTVIRDAWENLKVSVDWKDAQLFIFKKRHRQLLRDPHFCPYKGKCSQSTQEEDFRPEAQCGLQGTTDMTFSLQQIQEKCIGQIMLLNIFVDFTKAFHSEQESAMEHATETQVLFTNPLRSGRI